MNRDCKHSTRCWKCVKRWLELAKKFKEKVMEKFSWYTNPVKVTDYFTVYQYAVDREILIEKRKDGSRSFILVKKGTYVISRDGGWQRYKPNRKGGHRHNHDRNVLERKLNKSKDSRNRCHNVINRRGW